jgi:hypothetical protein
MKDKLSVAGKFIVDWEGNPIGKKGLVFFNKTDDAWQAVAGDGDGVLIMNQVEAAQAKLLHKAQQAMGRPDDIDLEGLKSLLAYADEIGIDDIYNSNRRFITDNMTPVDSTQNVVNAFGGVFGHMKRDARDISTAIYVEGPFQFQGPAATAQVFERGGILLRQGDSMRGVQPDVFRKSYRLAEDGATISDLSLQIMRFIG